MLAALKRVLLYLAFSKHLKTKPGEAPLEFIIAMPGAGLLLLFINNVLLCNSILLSLCIFLLIASGLSCGISFASLIFAAASLLFLFYFSSDS